MTTYDKATHVKIGPQARPTWRSLLGSHYFMVMALGLFVKWPYIGKSSQRDGHCERHIQSKNHTEAAPTANNGQRGGIEILSSVEKKHKEYWNNSEGTAVPRSAVGGASRPGQAKDGTWGGGVSPWRVVYHVRPRISL